jgi:hypothetical protein
MALAMPQLTPVLHYIGGLTNRRDDVIVRVAGALPSSSSVCLHVPPSQFAQANSLALGNQGIHLGESVAPNDVPELAAQASALLFVESEKEPLQTYTRFSVSGKVFPYLMSNRPILAVGPSDQSSIRLLRASPRTHYATALSSTLDTAARRTIEAVSDTPAVPDQEKQRLDRLGGTWATHERLRRTLKSAAG